VEKIKNKKILLPALKKVLENFETHIKYKSEIIKCSLYAKILNFTALEIDNEDEADYRIRREEEEASKIDKKYLLRKEFLTKLQENLNYNDLNRIGLFLDNG